MFKFFLFAFAVRVLSAWSQHLWQLLGQMIQGQLGFAVV